VADHLSYMVSEEVNVPFGDFFPIEQLLNVNVALPWLAGIAIYLITRIFPHDMPKSYRKKLIIDSRSHGIILIYGSFVVIR